MRMNNFSKIKKGEKIETRQKNGQFIQFYDVAESFRARRTDKSRANVNEINLKINNQVYKSVNTIF